MALIGLFPFTSQRAGWRPCALACVWRITDFPRISNSPHTGFFISELPGDPDAMSETDVAALAQSTGFEFVESFRVHGGFTANFRKPRDHGDARIGEPPKLLSH